jgi:catalase
MDMMSAVGKKTPCFARFSTTAGERGSADAVRDARGFAVKFYTDEGVFDFLGNNVPFFFIRDPQKFPSLVHAQKKNPASNLKDATRFWKWVVENQESLHMVLWLFSDYGAVTSWRHMNSYLGHAYKWVMPDGSWKYVHMYLEADAGYKLHSDDDIARFVGANTDYLAKDLHDAIGRGEYPTYTAKVQVVDPRDVRRFGYNILDMTKHWNINNYPSDMGSIPPRAFGKLTLNRSPDSHFDQVEQAAFSPSRLVPGIEPSEDPLLQARLFAYPDAQRYRLGAHNQRIPINVGPNLSPGGGAPRDARAGQSSASTSKEPRSFTSRSTPEHEQWLAEVLSKSPEELAPLDLHFARTFWTHLEGDENYQGWQERLVKSLAADIAGIDADVRQQVLAVLGKIHQELAARVSNRTAELTGETTVPSKSAPAATKEERLRSRI